MSNNPRLRKGILIVSIAIVTLSAFYFLLSSTLFVSSTEGTIPLSQVIALAHDGQVQEIQNNGDRFTAVLNNDTEIVFVVESREELLRILIDAGIQNPERLIKADVE